MINLDLDILKDADIRIINSDNLKNSRDWGLFLLIKGREGLQPVIEFLLSNFNTLDLRQLQIMFGMNLICTNNIKSALNQLERVGQSRYLEIM